MRPYKAVLLKTIKWVIFQGVRARSNIALVSFQTFHLEKKKVSSFMVKQLAMSVPLSLFLAILDMSIFRCQLFYSCLLSAIWSTMVVLSGHGTQAFYTYIITAAISPKLPFHEAAHDT